MKKIYKWGIEGGINEARHSENCLCVTKSWAINDPKKHCDCELEWLRSALHQMSKAIEITLNDVDSDLGKSSFDALNKAVFNAKPEGWIE